MNGNGYMNTMRTSMIKIDEIYQSLFVPYCRSFSKNIEVAYHYPFGHTDVDSIKVHIKGNDKVPGNYIYIQDQEPVNWNIHQTTIDEMKRRIADISINKKFAMITSELNSIDVARLKKYLGCLLYTSDAADE